MSTNKKLTFYTKADCEGELGQACRQKSASIRSMGSSRETSPNRRPLWASKVRRLQAGRSLRDIEREAGWRTNRLSNAMSSSSDLGVRAAISLARVLNVPVEWLFDDSRPVDSLPATPEQGVGDPIRMARVIGNFLVFAASQAEANSEFEREFQHQLREIAGESALQPHAKGQAADGAA